MSESNLMMFWDIHNAAYIFEKYHEEILFLLRYTAATSTLILVLFIIKWICDSRRRKKDK